eukprot:7033385-Alexandrium_andersonii.AAC.1
MSALATAVDLEAASLLMSGGSRGWGALPPLALGPLTPPLPASSRPRVRCTCPGMRPGPAFGVLLL